MSRGTESFLDQLYYLVRLKKHKETQEEGGRISNYLFFFFFNFWDAVFKGSESKVKCGKLGFSLPFTKAFVTFPPQRSSDLRVAVESRQKALFSHSFFILLYFPIKSFADSSNRTKQPTQKNTEKKIMLPGGINLLVLRWMEFLLTLLRQGEGRSALHEGWGSGA